MEAYRLWLIMSVGENTVRASLGCIALVYLGILSSFGLASDFVLVIIFGACLWLLQLREPAGLKARWKKNENECFKEMLLASFGFDVLIIIIISLFSEHSSNDCYQVRRLFMALRCVWFYSSRDILWLGIACAACVNLFAGFVFDLNFSILEILFIGSLAFILSNCFKAHEKMFLESSALTPALSGLKSEIEIVKNRLQWFKSMSAIREKSYRNLEHKLGNPAQSIFLVLDEIAALNDEVLDELRTLASKDDASRDSYGSCIDKVKEIDGLVEIGILAVDIWYVTRAELNDVVLCELLEDEKVSLQPTNLHWMAQRCHYILSSSSDMSTNMNDDASNVTIFNMKPEVSFSSNVDFSIKTCLMDDRWVFGMLYTFLENANRFTANGKITLSITLVKYPSDRQEFVRFQVSDTGTGVSVDPSLLYTFDSSRKDYVGFGLYQVKNRTSAMSGTCGYTPGSETQGSVFWVELPYNQTTVEARASQAPVRLLRPAKGASRSRKRLVTMINLPEFTKHKDILIVDDELIQRTLLGKHLESKGYNVEHAADGLEGLQMMQKKEFLVVLCDRVMPRMTGTECVGEFRLWESKKRRMRQFIVGLSANRDQFDADIDMALNKPIRPSDICKLLELTSAQNDRIISRSPNNDASFDKS